MMITIYGLPAFMKYNDLTNLIKQKCNINDFILDSMVNEPNGTKKVRVGLADDSEGNHFMKSFDGYRVAGHVLKLVPVLKVSHANVPQQGTYDSRDNYQQRNEYPNPSDRGVRPMETPRPGPWAANTQWQPNQPVQAQMQNTNFNYQQPAINAPYGQPLQMNQPGKPHFEPHRLEPNQGYAYSQKSNLISLGPQRNIQPGVIHGPPEAYNRSLPPNRYPSQQNYDMPEKPITIMKDNFQGPTLYNVGSIHEPIATPYQQPTQAGGWPAQHQPKPFEKPTPAPYEKKPYDDRKYPPNAPTKHLAETPKPEPFKGYDKGRQFSPPRRTEKAYRREMSLEGPTSTSGRQIPHAGRMSPGRRISPGRQVYLDRRSPGRRISPERKISPSGRQVYTERRSPGRRISPGRVSPGRRVSPRRRDSPGRHVALGRRVSPGGRISPGRKVSPGRQILLGRRDSPGRRVSPGRQIPLGRRDSPGRQIPVGRRDSPGRRVSPGRQIPLGRRDSLERTRDSPERRISPSGRQLRHGPERHFSPPGRQIPLERMSPGRKVSPTRKLSSPISHRRISPPRKEDYIRGRISPPPHSPMDRRMQKPSPDREPARGMAPQQRHDSPRRQGMRYSPPRHHADKAMDYQEGRPNMKKVRPAYEPPAQASNEAKYSGGYRPNVREDVSYPVRGQDQGWQEKEFPPKNVSDDRRDIRIQKFDMPRVSDQPIEQEPKTSRSPRRERSPGRDRFRRHSPSPRSPRRSWALEKRRSPPADMREPPPPPIWPGEDGKNMDYHHHSRPKFTERDHEKSSPVWTTPQDKKRDDFIRQRNADRERFEEEMRRRQGAEKWKPLPPKSPKDVPSHYMDDDHGHREDKFLRKDFEQRREYDREVGDRRPPDDRRERELPQYERDDLRYKADFKHKEEVLRKKEIYSGRIEDKKKEILKKQEQLQKEIDEVYKRAVDFTKKASLYKKGEEINDDGYDIAQRLDEDDDEYYRSRKEYPKDEMQKRTGTSSPAIKSKRATAVEQIAEKIMTKNGSHLPSDLKHRVMAELEFAVSKILTKMFGNEDVSFIELVIKFNSKHTPEDEENIFDDVMRSFPSHYRRVKRSAKDNSEIPAKSSRHSDEHNVSEGAQPRANEQRILTKRRLKVMQPPLKTLTKRPVDSSTSAVAVSSAKKQKLEDQSKAIADEEEPTEEEQGDGRFELNELMTKVIEDELQTIMIKVWRTIPDHPRTDAEKLVTEKLKNEASDDLRNVLGLNLSKRLLNIFNPLYIKLKFTGRPESGCLTEFINKYNIKNFKRTVKDKNLFAARMLTISDFDRICNAEGIRCGSAKVLVSPCYNFSRCPPKLNTIFINKTNEANLKNDTNVEKKEDGAEKKEDKPYPIKKETPRMEQESVDGKSDEKAETPKVIVKRVPNTVTVQNKISKVNEKSSELVNTKKATENSTNKEAVLKPKVNTPVTTPAAKVVITKANTVNANKITEPEIKKPAEPIANTVPKTTMKTDIEPATKTVTAPVTIPAAKVTVTKTNTVDADKVTEPEIKKPAEPIAKTVPKTTKTVTEPATKTITAPVTTPPAKVTVTKTNTVDAEKVTESQNKKPAEPIAKTVPKTTKTITEPATKTVTAPVTTPAAKVAVTKANTVNANKVAEPEIKKTVEPVAKTVPKPTTKTVTELSTKTVSAPVTTPAVRAAVTKANTVNANKVTEPEINKTVQPVAETVPKPTTNAVTEPATKKLPQPVATQTAPKKVIPPTTKKVVQAPTKVVQTPAKKVVQSKTKKVIKPKSFLKNTKKINSQKFDDTDEMDDEEILALISTGIVVDECSGSDEE